MIDPGGPTSLTDRIESVASVQVGLDLGECVLSVLVQHESPRYFHGRQSCRDTESSKVTGARQEPELSSCSFSYSSARPCSAAALLAERPELGGALLHKGVAALLALGTLNQYYLLGFKLKLTRYSPA